MILSKSKYGFTSIVIGLIALFIAIFSFWSDPFMPTSTAEPTIEEKFFTFNESLIDKFKNEPSNNKKLTLANVITIAVPALSILAIILALISYLKKESTRIVIAGSLIAVSAIIFQVIAAYTLFLFFLLALIAIAMSLAST